jgi:two-component system, OmpR family, phosphate regulon sensor histidine kinase PhoR
VFWQLYPAYLAITLTSVAAVGLYAVSTTQKSYRQQTIASLRDVAYATEAMVRGRLATGDYQQLDAICKELGAKASTRITVIIPSGLVVADSFEAPEMMDNHANREEVRQALAEGFGIASRLSDTMQEKMLYAAVPVQMDGRTLGVVRTSVASVRMSATLWAIHSRLAVASMVVGLLAAGVSFWLARRLSRPVEEIRRVAEELARGNLHHRLPIPMSKEAAQVAETMNNLAAQLDARLGDVLQQKNEREAILSSMIEGVVAIDDRQRVISLNHAAARLFDCDANAMVGRTLQEVVRNVELHQLTTEVLARRQSLSGELTITGRDGQRRLLHAQGTVLRDADDRLLGAVIVLHDVTRLNKLEQVRRDFVANVSHELRTPVTSIKGFVETLLDGALTDPDHAERFLRIVAVQADRLNSIIEDLLTLARIEQDGEKVEILLKPGAVVAVLEAAVNTCRLKADEKQVRLELQCDAGLAAPMNAALLEQAVVNLVDNAVKYSSPGAAVRLIARRDVDGVVIQVEDQGCGIAAEHLSRIFERFYRVDRARSRELGGTGLGLSIVKHIAQAHGGRAEVESTVGEGSVFSIRLPANSAKRPTAAP